MRRPSTTRRRPAPVSCRRLGLRPLAVQPDSDQDIEQAFEIGYDAGVADEAARNRRVFEQIRRLAEACEASAKGDPSLMNEVIREQGGDLLDVADAAGVSPLAEVDGGQLVDALEAWLRGQDDAE